MADYPVLAFDTCGALGTVALFDLQKDTNTVTCLQWVELPPKSFSAQLIPVIAGMLKDAGLLLTTLRVLVVVNGPGSFTGERVGLSTAKGLAHATGLPIVAVSRLAVLASLSPQPACLTLLDAGRGEFYAGRYRDGHCEREWLATHHEVTAAAEMGEPLIVAEPPLTERLATLQPVLVGPLDASAAMHAALARLRAADWDDLGILDANYLRRSDAELFARAAPRSE